MVFSMEHQETATTHEYTYTVVFELAPEGGYTVTVPALPGVVTEGDTLEEAREMVIDAIEGYLELLQDDGVPIPVDTSQAIEKIKEPVKVRLKA